MRKKLITRRSKIYSGRVLLIDADSVYPNVALMKLAGYYKRQNCDVVLQRLNIPYSPSRIKHHHFIDTTEYDLAFCSVVFNENHKYIHGDRIDYGGSSYSLHKDLPEVIEYGEPDYSIYPDNDASYGFITRGCVRNCKFCIVQEKEGKIRQVAEVADIVRHNRVRFLDNNILGFPGHEEILQELIDRKVVFQFNQGLDIRLLNERNAELLSKCSYWGDPIFAFDNYKMRGLISSKLHLLWRGRFRTKFYVYVHPDMPLSDTVRRVEWLLKRGLLPYVMRDIECWNSYHSPFYTDIVQYSNAPRVRKYKSFKQHMNSKVIPEARKKYSLQLYREAKRTRIE